MKCTEKERQSCNVEKMGHDGCAYAELLDVLPEKLKRAEAERDFYKERYLECINAILRSGKNE